MKLWLKSALLLLILSAGHLWGMSAPRDMAKESEIEAGIAAMDPAMVTPFREARIAFDKGDFAGAEPLLRTVCEHLPTCDHAFRRLGATLDLQGKHAESLKFAEKAVTLNRSWQNLLMLAKSVGAPANGSSSENDKARALAMLDEARKQPGGDDADVLAFTAQLNLQLDRKNEAKEVITALQKNYPDDMVTHYLAALAAVMDEHWVTAEREIKTAGKMGLPEEEVRRFLDSGVQIRATGWYLAGIAGAAAAAWLAGLLMLFVLGVFLSKKTLRQAASADVAQRINPGEQRLRRIYRTLLNIAGIYYYMSLPVVMVLLIGVFAAVFYAFWVIGYLPIKLLAILGIGAFLTIWNMGRSIFLKVKTSDPGRPLEQHEAEGLWQLTREVAQTLDTRPIDEIRLTIGTELAVYERGSWREKLDNKAKRILILGAAVLDHFKQDDFRSVLAHEYGHFSNRDTAGGDIAMRVENDMLKFYRTMCEAGQATKLNAGFQFLRLYHFIFRRISHGATRLQEILADRVAAQTYGPAAFEGGLRHVIAQTVAFGARADLEVEEAIKNRRPLNNLYEALPSEPANVRDEFEKAINRPTTPDDTHPSPMERFRLISNIPDPHRPSAGGTVWDLFKDKDAIIREMMGKIEENVAPHRPHL